jgi:hypothetical protein
LRKTGHPKSGVKNAQNAAMPTAAPPKTPLSHQPVVGAGLGRMPLVPLPAGGRLLFGGHLLYRFANIKHNIPHRPDIRASRIVL